MIFFFKEMWLLFCQHHLLWLSAILPDGDVANVKVLHVVRTLHVIVHDTFACAAERLNGVNLTFLENNKRKENTLASQFIG